MKSVVEYDNYRLYLRDLLADRRSRNTGQSLRSLAGNLGLSPAHFSRILTGQRRLSLETAHKLARALSMAHEESLHFLDLIQLESSDEKLQRRSRTAIEAAQLQSPQFISIEKFKVISDWFHFAILSLAMTKGFRPDPLWIAKRIGISVLDAKVALERLVRLELIEIEGRKVRVRQDVSIQTPHDFVSVAVRENHKQHLALASRALDEIEVDHREFCNRTLTFDPRDMVLAKKKIRHFIDRFNREMEKPNGQEVYQINIQFYGLSKNAKALES